MNDITEQICFNKASKIVVWKCIPDLTILTIEKLWKYV